MYSWLFLLLLSSCSIFLSGKDSVPSAKGSQYSINFKSQNWILKNTDERSDYVYENKDGRILLSNSFCNEFQEQALEKLAAKTFQAVKDYKSIKSEATTFNDREAYRMEGTGSVDGVNVTLRLLNTRRNNCYFDFVAIDPLTTKLKVDASFEDFLKSVEFK